jgi:hypothetical protein
VRSAAAILIGLGLWGGQALAADRDALLRQAAATGRNQRAVVDGQTLQVIHLGEDANCSRLAIVERAGGITNFSLCGDAVQERQGPVAAWIDDTGARAFAHRVVLLARRYGSSSGLDENGFRIRVLDLGPAGAACHNFELQVLSDDALTHLERIRDCS